LAVTLKAPPGLGRLAPALRALVRAALAAEGRTAGEIGIVLTDDAELRALNRRWRGIDRATDVLSFGYDERGATGGGPLRAARSALPFLAPPRRTMRGAGARRSPSATFVINPGAPAPASARRESVAKLSPAPGPGQPVSGDLVISMDRMEDQARRYRVTLGRELARLALHGALHLAGLDHQRPAERRRMRLAEGRALRAAASAVRALDRVLAPERRR